MIRNTLGIVSLALVLSACGGTTSKTTEGPIATAEIEKQLNFEDFAASYSQDGKKAVFISQRDADLAHVYGYDASLAPNQLFRLDDKLALVPSEGKEFLAAISASGLWSAMGRVTLATGLTQLYAVQGSGPVLAKIDLPAGHALNELSFAKGSDDYLAYVERVGTAKTLKVLKLAFDGSQINLSEIGSFSDQEKADLILIDGKLQLVSLTTTDALNQIVTVQNYDPALLTWTVTSNGQLSQSRQSIERPYFVSKAGLFTAKTLTTTRTRKRQGSAPAVGTAAADMAVVLEEIKQDDIFQAALPYNWTAEAYLASESLTLSELSGSLDGQVLLASGLDSYACAGGSVQIPMQKLIRQSDSKVISWVPARKTGEPAWTEIITNPCSLIDNPIGTIPRQFDATAARGEFVGFDGEFVVVALESVVTGDRELRLARFKIDWDAGTISEATILEVSANPRPAL